MSVGVCPIWESVKFVPRRHQSSGNWLAQAMSSISMRGIPPILRSTGQARADSPHWCDPVTPPPNNQAIVCCCTDTASLHGITTRTLTRMSESTLLLLYISPSSLLPPPPSPFPFKAFPFPCPNKKEKRGPMRTANRPSRSRMRSWRL